MQIYDLSGQVLEKLRHAIAFTYDHVNARVSVTILFPEPMCLRAVVSYLDHKLPNGDFDIIVLSSKLLFNKWSSYSAFPLLRCICFFSTI